MPPESAVLVPVRSRQRGLQDRRGDGRGDPPAGLLARPRLALDDHRDRHRAGSPSGPAKPMIQAWLRGGSVPSWAVPVLPPTTVTPGAVVEPARCRR